MRTTVDDVARLALFPQWMMVLSGAVVLAGASLGGISIRVPYAVVGGGLVLAATFFLILAPRLGASPHSVWFALVPVVDIVAVGIQRGAFEEPFPLAGLLYAIPLAWLAFTFPLRFAAAGVFAVGLWPVVARLAGGDGFLWYSALVAVVFYWVMGAIVVAAVVPIRRAFHRQRIVAAERARALEAVVSASEDAIIVYDADGSVRLANEAGTRMIARTGFARGVPAPTDLIRVYAADRRTPLTFTVETLFAMAASDRPARTVWVGEPGDQIAARYVVAPIDRAAPSAGIVVSVADITELIESIEIRDAFLDIVSHELRTPMTVLFGHVDLALEERDPDALRARLALIDEGLTQMRDRVERLLVSQREVLAAVRDTSDPTFVIDEVVAELSGLAAEWGVTLHRRIRAVPTARLNARSLHIILTELVKNAILYNRAGGSVEIRAYADDEGRAVIEIADTGVGMSPDERRRAFERFYRAPDARRRGVPGTGLGLSMVASLAARSEIELELSGNSAGGTTVTLALPPG